MKKKDCTPSLFDDETFEVASSKSSKAETSGEECVNKSHAMEKLGFSRHTFDKAQKDGLFQSHTITNSKGKEVVVYYNSELDAFMQTEEFRVLDQGTVDPRNPLNDLTGKEWLPETKSYFFQKGLGADHPEAQIEKLHPAPYSFQDIEKLILFFTKRGMTVLDPFGGVASTAKACELTGRTCISIELSEKFHNLSIKRLETEVGKGASEHHQFINGDSCAILPTMDTNSVDFMVTSPPYWGILNKLDQKVIKNRVANNLDTKYSESDLDLGNVEDYNVFLDILTQKIFMQCARIVRPDKYLAIVVSDFRDKGDFISFHSDIIQKLNHAKVEGGGELVLQGTKILIQNHKSLLPYGYPFSYVENIHHQYVLLFRKK